MVKEYYSKYQSTPSFETLETNLKTEISTEMVLKIVLDMFKKKVQTLRLLRVLLFQETMKFCKQQELQRLWTRTENY
jgi:hypothetical protein